MAGTTEFKQLKCKTCGEPLNLSAAKDGIIICGVCDSVFTLPKKEALPEVVTFLKQGEHELDTGRFDDAHAAFAKAAELDKTEPEAYFGMALAEFKIQYLKDEANNRLQPISHEINDKDFEDNSNFLKALRYATEAQRAEYERRGKEINYIKDEFYKLEQSGLDYDCFICVKVSDENGGRTQDYKIADDIYFELKGKGYKPFFSERELGGVTGADYEARILYALYSSECMLVVCFDEAYLRTKWVKNEYTRFLKLVNDEEKESDSIALVFGKRPVEKLPNRHGKIQGIAVNALSAMERIVSFVDSHTPEAKRKREEAKRAREEEAKRKERENEELRNELAELKKMFLSQQSARLAEEERAKKEAEEQAKKEAAEREEKERKEREAAERAKREAEEKAKAEAAALKAAEEQAKKKAEEKAKKEAAAAQAAAETEAKRENERKYAEKRFQEKVLERNADRLREAGKDILAGIMADIDKETKQAPSAKSTPAPVAASTDFVIENGVLKKYNGISTEVIIPEGVTEIGEKAFEKSEFIKKVIIPDSVKRIYSEAFADCKRLSEITIPNSVTRLGLFGSENCFRGCTSLEKIEVGKDNAYFKSENNCLLSKDGKGLITGCKNSVIPNGVTKIFVFAFSGCRELKTINIPDSIISISNYAFENCSKLESVTIPESVTEIGKSAFIGCANLTAVTLPKRFSDKLENIFGKKIINSGKCRFNFTGETKPNAFSAKAALPAEPTSAPAATAQHANNSDFLIIAGVLHKYKGKDTKAVIPNSVASINKSAFENCGEIISITIPHSVKEIGYFAFYNCNKLEKITYNGTKAQWGVIKKDFDWNAKTSDFIVRCIDGDLTKAGKVVSRFAVTEQPAEKPSAVSLLTESDFVIENGILKKYTGKAKNIVVPEGVTIVGWGKASVFAWDKYSYNTYIETITLPEGVLEIGSYAFAGCKNLQSINIPSSVKKIDDSAFYHCESLKRVDITDIKAWCNIDFKVIGYPYYANPLYYARQLYLNGERVENLVLPNGINTIKKYAFARCSLTSVSVPASVTEIGSSAFAYTPLNKVVLSERITSIGWHAFEECTALRNIVIPQSVTEMESDVFYMGISAQYSNLTIYCRAAKQPKGWDKDWNKKNDKLIGGRHKVVWGYKGD